MAARGLAIPYMIREGLIAERFFAGNDGDRAALRRNYLAARTVIAQSRENLDFLRSRLDLPAEKMVVTVDRHANTSSASIPLALVEAIQDGRIKAGDLVVMEAIGGGFVWGSAVVRW